VKLCRPTTATPKKTTMSMLDQNAYRKQSAIAEIAKAALQDADPLLDELARGEPALTPQRR
jgi:hypothetical protein